MDANNIYDLIYEGKYDEVLRILDEETYKSKWNILAGLAVEMEDISIIAFTYYAYIRTLKKDWLKLLKQLLTEVFCYVEGAYQTALYITRKQLEGNSEDLDLLSEIFYLAIVPETKNLISNDELIRISKIVYRKDPNNRDMLQTLKERGIDVPLERN